MKMLALGIVLGVLIALGGAVFAHRDTPVPGLIRIGPARQAAIRPLR